MKCLIDRILENPDAKEAVAKLVLEDPKTDSIVRHFKINRILSEEDIRGEFGVGLADGLNKVKSGIGDPLSFLRTKGVWAIRHAIRKELKRKIIQKCKCGRVVAVQRGSICPKCGDKAETTTRFSELNEDFHQIKAPDTFVENHTHMKMFVKTLSGRKRAICESILEGVDGDSYLQALADKFSCSPVAVAIHVKKIRSLWSKYNTKGEKE